MPLDYKDELLQIYAVIATTTIIAVVAHNCKKRETSCHVARKHGGSLPGKARYRKIGREVSGISLGQGYLLRGEEFKMNIGQNGSVFNEADCKRRFRMPRLVYNLVWKGLLEIGRLFSEEKDCVGIKFQHKTRSAAESQSVGGQLSGDRKSFRTTHPRKKAAIFFKSFERNRERLFKNTKHR